MATIHYTATAKDERLLELPEEAKALGLHPGDRVEITVNRNGIEESAMAASDRGMEVMRLLAERHKGRRVTDNSNTARLLREARGGAAYGYEPTE